MQRREGMFANYMCQDGGAENGGAHLYCPYLFGPRGNILMNAIKGSGPAGLSSIPRRRNIVVRPFARPNSWRASGLSADTWSAVA